MLLVSIDTCGPSGSIALARLADGELTLLGHAELPGKTYSARLIPEIRSLLASNGAAVCSLSAIVVTSGPGSFTGIRIGLSTAKGLAEAHGVAIFAVSRLAVLADKASKPAAALDASRGEFYLGTCADHSATENLVTGATFTQEALVLGTDLAVCQASARVLAPQATFAEPPTAADALRFALPRLRKRASDDPVTLDGNYLRRSDAEIFAKSHP